MLQRTRQNHIKYDTELLMDTDMSYFLVTAVIAHIITHTSTVLVPITTEIALENIAN